MLVEVYNYSISIYTGRLFNVIREKYISRNFQIELLKPEHQTLDLRGKTKEICLLIESIATIQSGLHIS